MEDSAELEDSKLSSQDLTLICVDSDELMRRISSLIERKREEINAYNNREFLDEDMYKDPEGEVCARIAPACVKREVSKNHISASRVSNVSGPQIAAGLAAGDHKTESNQNSSTDSGVDERLKNLESVVNIKLKPGSAEKLDVSRRLKVLEDKVQFLMGVSPEYFSLPSKPQAPSQWSFPSSWTDGPYATEFRQDMSTEEIDDKMAFFKELLARERK